MRTIDLTSLDGKHRTVILCYVCDSELLTFVAKAEMRPYSGEMFPAVIVEPCQECIKRAVEKSKPKSDLTRRNGP